MYSRQGLNLRYNFTVENSAGELVDADALPVVNIMAQSGAFNTSIGVAHPATGEYSILLSYEYVALVDTIIITIEYELAGDTIMDTDYVYLYPTYFDIDNLSSKITANHSLADLYDSMVFANDMIHAVTRDKFWPFYDSIEKSGSGNDRITLDIRLLRLYRIYEDDVLIYDKDDLDNSLDIVIQPSKFAVRVRVSDNTISCNAKHGLFPDTSVYKIEGEFGWDAAPSPIGSAGRLLMDDFLCRDSIQRKKYVIENRNALGTVKFSEQSFDSTGNFYADKLLAPYIKTSLMVI